MGFFRDVVIYVEQGGLVMWPLVLATFVLWYVLGYRWMVLQRGSVRSVRVLFEKYRAGERKGARGVVDSAVQRGLALARAHTENRRRILDDAFADDEGRIGRGRTLVRSIVAVAPLAGLLGTVTGMIETFDSLAEMALFTQSGGIAAGISQALFTTQMGLTVAVPGIIVGSILDRRQSDVERELEQLKQILCTEPLYPSSVAMEGVDHAQA